RPEFINRIDATVVFQPLNREEIRKIVDLELVGVRKQLASQEITLIVTDEAKDHIATVGYDANFGARPLARQIQNEIADPLAEMLLRASSTRETRSGSTRSKESSSSRRPRPRSASRSPSRPNATPDPHRRGRRERKARGLWSQRSSPPCPRRRPKRRARWER